MHWAVITLHCRNMLVDKSYVKMLATEARSENVCRLSVNWVSVSFSASLVQLVVLVVFNKHSSQIIIMLQYFTFYANLMAA